MNLLKHFMKSSYSLIYIIRRKIPKKVHTKIGNLIKSKVILKNLFSLSYGVIISKLSQNYYRLIPLRRNLYHRPIIILDVQAVDVFYEVFIENSYEKHNKIKPGDIVFDVGANIGMFSIKAANSVGLNGKVIAIEPEPQNIRVLMENVKPFKNIEIIPKAAGSSIGEIDLSIGIHSGSHTVNNNNFSTSASNKISVPLETLDKIAKDQNIDEINFIKIDVEGYELEVLKGAVNILKNIKFFSIAAYHREEDNIRIAEFLTKHNFKVINDKHEIYAWNKTF
jgi:FkbM family methyltransferase